ncbi:lysophospholipid acyltransferase family protein [Streptomyces zagrosensis]|uniref:1-acyl-sn-glycerol-3-phosphate acyltransferase n=1 Tax=Streptomyces zagrosensis TaxID=1042984 RepID=A0A7W9QIM2_9ACTN|nr:lysophospholipid acyltransferase family protein [Streptomyces zagrosensis]MBB5939652.1 1-acyl-sn-glycerol-3-phosphate acyltransferase [Streptomyces zagrosensis]
MAHAAARVTVPRAARRSVAFARRLVSALGTSEALADPANVQACARGVLDALGIRLEYHGGPLSVLGAKAAPYGVPAPVTLPYAPIPHPAAISHTTGAAPAHEPPAGSSYDPNPHLTNLSPNLSPNLNPDVGASHDAWRAGTGTLIVANHISWLDVMALLAVEPVTMLAKREVGNWPVIGTLTQRAGTRFIDRDGMRALPQTVSEIAELLRSGRSVMVFPQGATWCAGTTGGFRRATFQAAIDAGAPVRPVTLGYFQHHALSTVAAFVGDDDFGSSLRRVMSADGLTVRVQAHPPIPSSAASDRRELAALAREAVRDGGPVATTSPVAATLPVDADATGVRGAACGRDLLAPVGAVRDTGVVRDPNSSAGVASAASPAGSWRGPLAARRRLRAAATEEGAVAR